MLLEDFGDRECNMISACQQFAISACLYKDRRDLLLRLLGDDHELVWWEKLRETWPPSSAIITGRDGRCWVHIEGTTNGWQAGGHLFGTFVRGDMQDVGPANGMWAWAVDQLRERWGSVLPRRFTEGQLHVSGHSYGGALACLLGVQEKNSGRAADVQILTFAQPRALTFDFVSPDIRCWWRLVSTYDLVPDLPPVLPSIPFSRWRSPINWIQSASPWWHYGQEVPLGPDGSLNKWAPFDQNADPWLVEFPPNDHRLRNHWARLHLHNERYLT